MSLLMAAFGRGLGLDFLIGCVMWAIAVSLLLPPRR